MPSGSQETCFVLHPEPQAYLDVIFNEWSGIKGDWICKDTVWGSDLGIKMGQL